MTSTAPSSYQSAPRLGRGGSRRLTAAEIGQLTPVLKVGLLGSEGKLSPRSQRPQTANSLRMLGSVYTSTLMSLDSQQEGERPQTATTLRGAHANTIPRPPSSRPSTANSKQSFRPSSSRRREEDATMGIGRDDAGDVCDDEVDLAFASKAQSRSAGRSRPWASATTHSARSQRSSSAASHRRPLSAATSEHTCSGVAGISSPRNEDRLQLGGVNLSSHPPFYSSFKHASISRYLSDSKKLVYSDSVDRMREYVRGHQEALEIAKNHPPEVPHVEEYSRTVAQQKRQKLLETLHKEYMRRQEIAASNGTMGKQMLSSDVGPGGISERKAHAIIAKRLQAGSVSRLNSHLPTTLTAKKIQKDFLYGHPIRPAGGSSN